MLKNEAALFCTPYANMRAQRNCLGEQKTKKPETNKNHKKGNQNKQKTSKTKNPTKQNITSTEKQNTENSKPKNSWSTLMLPWGLPLRVVEKQSQQGRPEHRSVVLASHFYRSSSWAGVWKCGLWEELCQPCSLCTTPAFLLGVWSLGICQTEAVFMTSPKQRAWVLCWVFN